MKKETLYTWSATKDKLYSPCSCDKRNATCIMHDSRLHGDQHVPVSDYFDHYKRFQLISSGKIKSDCNYECSREVNTSSSLPKFVPPQIPVRHKGLKSAINSSHQQWNQTVKEQRLPQRPRSKVAPGTGIGCARPLRWDLLSRKQKQSWTRAHQACPESNANLGGRSGISWLHSPVTMAS